MNKLPLLEAKYHVSKWIESCRTQLQLDTCKLAITTFINPELYDVDELELASIHADLFFLIEQQVANIASGFYNKKVERFPVCDEQQVQVIN